MILIGRLVCYDKQQFPCNINFLQIYTLRINYESQIVIAQTANDVVINYSALTFAQRIRDHSFKPNVLQTPPPNAAVISSVMCEPAHGYFYM